MLFLEAYARPLLVLHGVCAAVLVAASTHHLLWCRYYLRGDFSRARGERRFAWVGATAFVCTFALGNLLYPTYKVRVRAEYLDSPPAVLAEARLRTEAAARVVNGPRAAEPASLVSGVSSFDADLSWVGRLFDVKEHWVALGCAASLALLFLSRAAHPRASRALVAGYVGLSAFVCATAWTGALIGLVTASYRAVGGLR